MSQDLPTQLFCSHLEYEPSDGNVSIVNNFFKYHGKDKEKFYDLWVEDPDFIIPFVVPDSKRYGSSLYSGMVEFKQFWDPIFDEMTGTFDWKINELIESEDRNVVITRTSSTVNVRTKGKTWGDKEVNYKGNYLQIFRFTNHKISSLTEYFDSAKMNDMHRIQS